MSNNIQSLRELLAQRQPERIKQEKKTLSYSREFQVFGDRLTQELKDEKHRGLYMKLAKQENRAHLERALYFVKDVHAKNPARLFMWKLKQIKQQNTIK